jgi:hypothetical protein
MYCICEFTKGSTAKIGPAVRLKKSGSAICKSANCHICGRSTDLKNMFSRLFVNCRTYITGPSKFGYDTRTMGYANVEKH